MKILWFSITPPSSGIEALKLYSDFSGGGWIDSLLRFLPYNSEEIELYDSFLLWGQKNVLFENSTEYKNLHYVGIPSDTPFLDRTSPKMAKIINEIVNKIEPDIIHIFGTETENSNFFVSQFPDKKILISITGVVSRYKNHYFGGIERNLRFCFTFRDCIKGGVFHGYKKMCRNAEVELDTLRKAKFITGRTSWDKSIASIENPGLTYFHCDENLRDSFYNYKWSFQNCDRYSIFTSSSASPLKGTHQLIQAFSIVKKYYPTAKLICTGNGSSRKDSFHNKLRRTGYQKYLKKLVEKYGLDDSISFVGQLNEEQMASQFQHAHVYVLPSAIENSPNSLCEAMIIGVPAVASAVGGVPDLLEHGVDGFLYPFDEYYTLAYRIIQIFGDEKLAASFSEHSRERAYKRHDRKINAQKMIEIYKTIIEGSI